jgi:hypothetical protein
LASSLLQELALFCFHDVANGIFTCLNNVLAYITVMILSVCFYVLRECDMLGASLMAALCSTMANVGRLQNCLIGAFAGLPFGKNSRISLK